MASADVSNNCPLTLAQAVDLPELGGVFSVKQLRGAIDRGELEVERHGRRFFVTVAGVRRWRERCTTRIERPVSSRVVAVSEGGTETGAQIAVKAAFDAIAKLRQRPNRS